ncbi:MAG TPA: TIGR04282 family arsenosugar biosynthesis glycosyltransferase [Hyphomicrobiales bacterium]|nr:TIGR04282 family arsenosugar biosynthesis glycosyltransferase [Hyphomicrobiales bacterium]
MASAREQGRRTAFCGVAVMAKASYPGQAKTRLCPPLTFEEAAALNTAFLKDIADNLIALSADASIAGSMAFGPPGSEDFFRANLPPAIALHEVWYPDLGVCLIETLRKLFAAGNRVACVLNSDSPTLPATLLAEMANVLAEPGDRAVFGPCADGGYYLLALKSLHRRLFEDIAWSTPIVAQQTLERAAEIGLPVHILPEWYDVDDFEGIRLLMGELLEGRPFSPLLLSNPARHSLALLKSMVSNSDLKERLDRFIPDGLARLEGAVA